MNLAEISKWYWAPMVMILGVTAFLLLVAWVVLYLLTVGLVNRVSKGSWWL